MRAPPRSNAARFGGDRRRLLGCTSAGACLRSARQTHGIRARGAGRLRSHFLGRVERALRRNTCRGLALQSRSVLGRGIPTCGRDAVWLWQSQRLRKAGDQQPPEVARVVDGPLPRSCSAECSQHNCYLVQMGHLCNYHLKPVAVPQVRPLQCERRRGTHR